MSNKQVNKLTLDAADAVSHDERIARAYLKENAVDIAAFIKRGLKELKPATKQNNNGERSKSQNFFSRAVLAARIVHECHSEITFGSVKFQKLVYLCEQVSKMGFSTNYTKQAAGPMDNRFIHMIKEEFERQGWFKVEKVNEKGFEKVKFSPGSKLEQYKPYYESRFSAVEPGIQTLLNIFKKAKTDQVELVATIFSCWDEINRNKEMFSDKLIIQKVYAWHKAKSKFTEAQIGNAIVWMQAHNLHPVT